MLRQKQDLEKKGVPAEVRIRHGLVIDQLFAEAREQSYDLIVSARLGAPLHHGRPHPQHSQSRQLSRAGRARRRSATREIIVARNAKPLRAAQ
ncbi:MAG: hypothetical protein DME34_10030 [Verrucomicrobia bacterium]|nr:MAG: hypothetical protein DME34_10030 [Verrucomicrobiota bacterium]